VHSDPYAIIHLTPNARAVCVAQASSVYDAWTLCNHLRTAAVLFYGHSRIVSLSLDGPPVQRQAVGVLGGSAGAWARAIAMCMNWCVECLGTKLHCHVDSVVSSTSDSVPSATTVLALCDSPTSSIHRF